MLTLQSWLIRAVVEVVKVEVLEEPGLEGDQGGLWTLEEVPGSGVPCEREGRRGLVVWCEDLVMEALCEELSWRPKAAPQREALREAGSDEGHWRGLGSNWTLCLSLAGNECNDPHLLAVASSVKLGRILF